MSIPSGAKVLGTRIKYDNVWYLTDSTSTASAFSTDYFSAKLARPLANCEKIEVDPAIIRTVENGLPETINNSASAFATFPGVYASDKDITVGSTETFIDISFISEGAGYLNTFGYYFYYLDESELPIVLTTDTENNPDDLYYHPTVVFPNASFSRSGGDLKAGDTRRLKGNLPNGKFKNVRVGFFLLANAWTKTGSGALGNGTGKTVHTTNQLNSNYSPAYIATITDPYDPVQIADYRTGMQTMFLFYVTKNSWVLSFEDVTRPPGDSDFNDLILLIKKTPEPDSDEKARYAQITPIAATNSKGKADSDGLFLWLDITKVCNDGSDMIFTRNMTFNTENITYIKDEIEITQSPKDYVKSIMQKLNWNYTDNADGLVEEDETSNTLKQVFRFRPSDIADHTVDGYVKLYIMEREYNIENTTPVNDAGQTNYEVLLDYQHVFADYWYSTEGESKYIDHESFSFMCGETRNMDLDEPNTNFEKITIVLLAWGDPYIQLLDSSKGSYKLPDVEGRYTLLQNSKILIQADTAKSPDTELSDDPNLRGTTFFKRFVIDIHKKTRFEIDLNQMSFMSQGNQIKFSTKYDKEAVRNIEDKNLIKCIEDEPKLKTLTVFIEGIKVTFLRLPTHIDIQNLVLFDMGTLKYYVETGSVGGMISEQLLKFSHISGE